MAEFKNKWEEYKVKNGVTPLDLINVADQTIPHEASVERYAICKNCPKFVNLTRQCRECGCVMPFKVKLDKAKCPLGHWGPYEAPEADTAN